MHGISRVQCWFSVFLDRRERERKERWGWGWGWGWGGAGGGGGGGGVGRWRESPPIWQEFDAGRAALGPDRIHTALRDARPGAAVRDPHYSDISMTRD